MRVFDVRKDLRHPGLFPTGEDRGCSVFPDDEDIEAFNAFPANVHLEY
jgi:hypothetical protein